jgi:hypothetical protein
MRAVPGSDAARIAERLLLFVFQVRLDPFLMVLGVFLGSFGGVLHNFGRKMDVFGLELAVLEALKKGASLEKKKKKKRLFMFLVFLGLFKIVLAHFWCVLGCFGRTWPIFGVKMDGFGL